MRWFCNKIKELHIHALMHAQGNTQLIETRVVHTGHMAIQVFSFVQSKLSEYQLCVPNWEYSSEHDRAYHPAASQPITSIILTSLFFYVL